MDERQQLSNVIFTGRVRLCVLGVVEEDTRNAVLRDELEALRRRDGR